MGDWLVANDDAEPTVLEAVRIRVEVSCDHACPKYAVDKPLDALPTDADVLDQHRRQTRCKHLQIITRKKITMTCRTEPWSGEVPRD